MKFIANFISKSEAGPVCDRKLKNVKLVLHMQKRILHTLSNRSEHFTYSLLLHVSLKIKSYWLIGVKKLRQVEVSFHHKVLFYILII